MTTTPVPQGNDRLAAALAEVKRLDPLDLLALYYLVENALKVAPFPRLIVTTETVEDYSESRDRGEVVTYQRHRLTCPHCGEDIGTDENDEASSLIAVDIAERWTGHASVSFEDRDIQWHYDGSADFEGLLYKHICNQPVRLPENWTER